tara:strand:+ start:548 stop:766 length:219 start_codon:yes stop_codon:yes gene_type:complete
MCKNDTENIIFGGDPPLTETQEILCLMDLPIMRRDTSKPENVRWLLRNLASRNADNPDFNRIIELLKAKSHE